jgi:hypothetical protein
VTVIISRLFKDYAAAQSAVKALEDAGIPEDDISIIANNADKWFNPDLASAAGKGAAVGAGFGGFGGLLAGLGLLAVPGLGPIVAAGWLAAAAAGAAAVGAAGSVIGMLAEAGVATNDAEVYAESIRRGGSLVSARVPDDQKAHFEAVLDPAADNIEERRTALAATGWQRFDPSAPDYGAEAIKRDRGAQSTGGSKT